MCLTVANDVLESDCARLVAEICSLQSYICAFKIHLPIILLSDDSPLIFPWKIIHWKTIVTTNKPNSHIIIYLMDHVIRKLGNIHHITYDSTKICSKCFDSYPDRHYDFSGTKTPVICGMYHQYFHSTHGAIFLILESIQLLTKRLG